jgi:hypothetical protein
LRTGGAYGGAVGCDGCVRDAGGNGCADLNADRVHDAGGDANAVNDINYITGSRNDA